MSIELATRTRDRKRQASGRRHFWREWSVSEGLAATWLVVLLVGMFLLLPILSLNPLGVDAHSMFLNPGSAHHLLGTDNLGRDLLARCLSGARVSVLVGVGSTAIAAAIGVPLGMLAAYLGGWVDSVVGFVVDTVLAFPGLVLALALASFLGGSITNVMIAIFVPMAPVFARLARAQTLAVITGEYVDAAEIMGASRFSVMTREILPNIAQTLLAFGFVSMGRAVLIEGGLSFLGAGVPPPQPTWGGMINEARLYLPTNPWLIAAPALFLMLTILSLNMISDRFAGDEGRGAKR